MTWVFDVGLGQVISPDDSGSPGPVSSGLPGDGSSVAPEESPSPLESSWPSPVLTDSPTPLESISPVLVPSASTSGVAVDSSDFQADVLLGLEVIVFGLAVLVMSQVVTMFAALRR